MAGCEPPHHHHRAPCFPPGAAATRARARSWQHPPLAPRPLQGPKRGAPHVRGLSGGWRAHGAAPWLHPATRLLTFSQASSLLATSSRKASRTLTGVEQHRLAARALLAGLAEVDGLILE